MLINNTCVYFHINPLKNEIFYVGIGNKERPYKKHHRSKLWFNIVNKYGYIVDICETNLSWKEACEKERFYIKKIGRRDLGLGSLVNHTNGGDGVNGYIITEEYKNKLKLGQSKRAPRSKESSIKISNSLKNLPPEIKKKVSDKHKKPILQFNLNNELIKEWDGGIDIQLELGILKSSITQCCKNQIKTSGGFIWKYKNANK
jgi:hypothetical protein